MFLTRRLQLVHSSNLTQLLGFAVLEQNQLTLSCKDGVKVRCTITR